MIKKKLNEIKNIGKKMQDSIGEYFYKEKTFYSYISKNCKFASQNYRK